MKKDAESYYKVEFHDSKKPETVGDGEILTEDLDFYEFPGVSVCIPIVITDRSGKRVFAAIHADPNWTPDRLADVVKNWRRKGARKLLFAQRIQDEKRPGKLEYVPENHPNRRALLAWINSKKCRLHVEKTEIIAESYIDHIGYSKKEGFKKIEVVWS